MVNEEIREQLDELASAANDYANCRFQDRQKMHDALFTAALKLGEAWAIETADVAE